MSLMELRGLQCPWLE